MTNKEIFKKLTSHDIQVFYIYAPVTNQQMTDDSHKHDS